MLQSVKLAITDFAKSAERVFVDIEVDVEDAMSAALKAIESFFESNPDHSADTHEVAAVSVNSIIPAAPEPAHEGEDEIFTDIPEKSDTIHAL